MITAFAKPSYAKKTLALFECMQSFRANEARLDEITMIEKEEKRKQVSKLRSVVGREEEQYEFFRKEEQYAPSISGEGRCGGGWGFGRSTAAAACTYIDTVMGQNEDRSEIAFFDVETTIPNRQGQGFALLEFGSILVCPKKLEELYSYSTLVRPTDPSLISSLSVRCNGITPDTVVSAPTFAEIADKGGYGLGHNIVRFDCARIREHLQSDTYLYVFVLGIDVLLSVQMATLATYFGLGQQSHRSLDDVRMNLEVLKYCATVLFLESSLPDIFTVNSWVSPNATTRSRSNIKSSPGGTSQNHNTPSSRMKFEDAQNLSPPDKKTVEDHPILSLVTHRAGEEISDVASRTDQPHPFDMSILIDQMETQSIQPDATMEEKSESESPEISSKVAVSEGPSGYAGFIEPDEVSIPSVNACLVPLFEGSQIRRTKLLHKEVILQLWFVPV
ncbi:hypothetical protein JRO89_XS13G0252000 [Xanthoceras sorbifolium]|uniref:Exonuclease domain-containing protein n=1 Tax=Xanthoceras sorbifolium TaxID=99658 RepID=A0ABQ8H9V1_9ROSI|nr:hypothetical protein JRO89_XS13G0252000 [Xanthoceras sorbifolium]